MLRGERLLAVSRARLATLSSHSYSQRQDSNSSCSAWLLDLASSLSLWSAAISFSRLLRASCPAPICEQCTSSKEAGSLSRLFIRSLMNQSSYHDSVSSTREDRHRLTDWAASSVLVLCSDAVSANLPTSRPSVQGWEGTARSAHKGPVSNIILCGDLTLERNLPIQRVF
jgi:hypothetical protein